ncbi:MAG: PilZ domain-containing protein [Planctomycetota bacterium]
MSVQGTDTDRGAGNPAGAERRRHTRVEAGGICLLAGSEGHQTAFELLDLSESGARLRCERGLPAMTRVGVILVLPAQRIGQPKDARLDITGVVVWSHEAETKVFDTGVFFPELDDDARTALKAYVTASA